MSAAIRNSLKKLNNAVQHLESALENKKAALRAAPKKLPHQSGDLFTAMATGQPQPVPHGSPLNVKVLAKRLDNAIDQVERILKEGRA